MRAIARGLHLDRAEALPLHREEVDLVGLLVLGPLGPIAKLMEEQVVTLKADEGSGPAVREGLPRKQLFVGFPLEHLDTTKPSISHFHKTRNASRRFSTKTRNVGP